jgi:hypothetical protein
MTGSLIGIFRSQAPLENIHTIRACYIDNRCTGMAIKYRNSTVETLGRWFESLGGRHTLIYDSRYDKLFKKLRFEMCGVEGKRIVKNIYTIPNSRPVTSSDAHIVSKSIWQGVCIECYSYHPTNSNGRKRLYGGAQSFPM